MKIRTYKQLQQILTKAAKDAGEDVLEIHSGRERHQGIEYKICTLKFERYNVEVQQIRNSQEEYAYFRVVDSTIGETELWYLARILRKNRIGVPTLQKQITFQTRPTKDEVSRAFQCFITSERKINKARGEYLEKLEKLVEE